MPSTPSNRTLAVIGAGVSGLTAAAQLQRSGWSVRLFDKGRGPGGRAATRRSASGGFDHGAPYFTVQTAQGRALVERLYAQGVVAPWSGRFASVDAANAFHESPAHERWVGRPKMSALGRYLSRDLEVNLSTRIVTLGGKPGAWTLVDENEHHHGSFHAVLMSCPGPQAATLLPKPSALHARCLAMRYAVCWAGLVELTAQEPFAWDSLSFEAGTLGEAFRSNSKPERSGAERWVVHAAPDWSSAHRHHAPEVVGQALTEAFEEATGQKVHTMTVHRWLYARALQSEGEVALIDSERRLGLCGDGMTGGGVEAAYISGLELAKQVQAHF